MLELTRRSPTGLKYFADDPRGFELELRIPSWSRQGFILDDDLKYEVRAKQELITLQLGVELIADAVGRAMRWQVATSDQTFEIRQPSITQNASAISRDGLLIGKLEQTSKLRGRVTCELPDDLHPVVQAFIATVGIIGWREVESSLHSGSAGGGG